MYIKDPLSSKAEVPYPEPSGAPRAREIFRYRVTIRVLSFEDGSSADKNLECSLFVVKGNPLVLSECPLPCLASGTNNFVIEVRSGDDLSGTYVQAIVPSFSAHMGVPLDELLEYATLSQTSVERSMTMWDTQTGKMRGTALMEMLVVREEPMSYPAVLAARKTFRNQEPVGDSNDLPKTTISSTIENPTAAAASPLSYFTGGADLMAAAREWVAPWEAMLGEKKTAATDEKEKLESVAENLDTVTRRKRGGTQGFAVV